MTTTINLSAQGQIRILDGNSQQAAVIAAAAQPGVLSPTKFVFFAAFDGTNNDLKNKPQVTNVAQLFLQGERAGNVNHVAAYFAGPGTPKTLPGSSAVPNQVTRQVIATAQAAYRQFFALASTYSGVSQPGSISAALTSFSRGGASAAIFSQLVWVNGGIGISFPSTPHDAGVCGRIGPRSGELVPQSVMIGHAGGAQGDEQKDCAESHGRNPKRSRPASASRTRPRPSPGTAPALPRYVRPAWAPARRGSPRSG